jgi:indole-3-glycerol phosphate synthase
MSMLEPILETTRRRIDDLPDLADLRRRAGERTPARNLAGALTAGGLQVVAEIKRRSPSAGALAPGLDPVAQAVAYERGGAAAISVLTEPDHFAGSLDDLVAVRDAVAIPVLRKDFTLSPSQIWEARASGADAVLLIVAALSDDLLDELLEVAADAGVAAIVEVHTVAEAETAVAAGARIVGVNNRDLTSFHTDLAVSERVAPLLSGVEVRIAESGVSDPEGAARMAAAGFHAVLVGEALVRAADPGALVASLRRATEGAPP